MGTKINGEFVEKVISCQFGYVCFVDPLAAKKALEDLNGKTLDGEKKALLIDYFMPKYERNQAL